MVSSPVMPKATAVWLVDNTTLTFKQIADFTGLHALEIEAIADGDVARNIVGRDPIASGELTADEIKACETDFNRSLKQAKSDVPKAEKRTKGPRYTPVARRGDKPDAIAWLLKNHPELPDVRIVKLIGTTKNTIEQIRSRSHVNMSAITAQNPVHLGLCTYADLNRAVEAVNKVKERAIALEEKAKRKAEREANKKVKAPKKPKVKKEKPVKEKKVKEKKPKKEKKAKSSDKSE